MYCCVILHCKIALFVLFCRLYCVDFIARIVLCGFYFADSIVLWDRIMGSHHPDCIMRNYSFHLFSEKTSLTGLTACWSVRLFIDWLMNCIFHLTRSSWMGISIYNELAMIGLVLSREVLYKQRLLSQSQPCSMSRERVSQKRMF